MGGAKSLLEQLDSAIQSYENRIEELEILEEAARVAYRTLECGIKEILELDKWPNFYHLYGNRGSYADGIIMHLKEEVQKLRVGTTK